MRVITLHVDEDTVNDHLEQYIEYFLEKGHDLEDMWTLFTQLLLYGIAYWPSPWEEVAALLIIDVVESDDESDPEDAHFLHDMNIADIVTRGLVSLAYAISPHIDRILRRFEGENHCSGEIVGQWDNGYPMLFFYADPIKPEPVVDRL